MKTCIAILCTVVCVACGDSRSDLEKCADDPQCAAAMNAVDNAQQTVDTVCPKDQNKTNEACDSAMNALDSAQELQSRPKRARNAGTQTSFRGRAPANSHREGHALGQGADRREGVTRAPALAYHPSR